MRHFDLGLIFVGLLVMVGCKPSGEPTSTEVAPPRATPAVMASTQTPEVSAPTSNLDRAPGEFLELVPFVRQPHTLELSAIPVTSRPQIDGQAKDEVWNRAPATETRDFSSQRSITLKAVYTADEIFFLVSFPDVAPSTTHKSWRWDPNEEIYRDMGDREDMFVFKWSLSGHDINLSLREAIEPHRADIWFWKAHRTNRGGYADDKWQELSPMVTEHAKAIASPQHGTLYFRRVGDAGQSAYAEQRYYDFRGDVLAKYTPRQPGGSRADIRAKGVWHKGQWTIEWARPLQTTHDDDIAFVPGGRYLFGVSCYEMAHDQANPTWSQPLYRTGDIFDRLILHLQPKGDT